MKYLFLIVRHLFPRRRWVEVQRYTCTNKITGNRLYYVIELRDQFGNLKHIRVE